MRMRFFPQVVVLVLLFAGTLGAQEASSPTFPKFKRVLSEYNKTMKEAAMLQRKFLSTNTPDEEKEEIGPRLEEIAVTIGELHPQVMKLAEKAWLEQPNQDPELLSYVVQVLEIRLMEDDYEAVLKLLKGLLKPPFPDILPDVYDIAGETCFMMNDFERAERFYAKAEAAEVLSERGATLRKTIPYHRVAWAREKLIREKEAKADDLPRVRLKTAKGDIVLELYENEAPNTVANFVFLVEKGFYDGTEFFSVIPGLYAQGGRSYDTEDGGPGYKIKDELEESVHRKHYRGTISMVRAGKNSAGSQFFLSFAPNKEMDGEFVVFGRIIEGLDVLVKLQRVDASHPDPESLPDTIDTAEVVRSRDHVYRPKVIKPSKAKKATKKAKKGTAYRDTEE
ncbi:MAG: peptidylprolyl isomerase [Planctomycetia bacterium]|nr:peptidylprolyl isomerase [Planctomycetia bacterium]